MYCSLVTTVSFSVFSLLLFRLTFESCQHSLATLFSRKLFGYLSELYDSEFGFLLVLFNYFGKFVSKLFFYKRLPLGFYLHCYPLLGSLFSESSLPPVSSPLDLVRRFLFWFVNLFAALLNKPLNYSHVYGFFGLLVSVRLFFFSLLLLSLVVVVKYFNNLLKFKSFENLLALVLLPAFVFANLFNFLTYNSMFSFWYLTGLLPVAGSLYYSHTKYLLRGKKK